MLFSGMIKLRFLKVCRIKSIERITFFLSFILEFLTFLKKKQKKKDNITQHNATVKNEKKKKEEKKKEEKKKRKREKRKFIK